MPISQDQITALQSAFPFSRREELARISSRARADLEHIFYAMGTGAPSTVKRTAAVEFALDGKDVPAIAAAVSLPQARVERILENVLVAGLPALYPSFEEEVPTPEGTHLWGTIEPLIKSMPPSSGVFTACWYPPLVADYLIHKGILQDTSVSQITNIIKQNLDSNSKPPCFDYVDTQHNPDQRLGSFGNLLSLFLGFGIIAFGILVPPHIPIVLFGGVWTFLMTVNLIKQIQEQKLLRKVVASKPKGSIPGGEPLQAAPPRKQRSDPLPFPSVRIMHALSLPEIPWATDNITDTANALGQSPLRALYLWVFAAQADQRGFETEGWPQLGSVHLLLNATALTMNQLAHSDKFLISTRQRLDETIAAFRDVSGTHQRPDLFYTLTTGAKNMYRGYPIHTLVCNDDTWQPAFHEMASRCDIAIVNLSGYNPSHPGLEYEIRHLFSGGPPSQFVFIYERTTDADAVINSVLNLWAHLETDPQIVPELLFLRVPDSQDAGYAIQFQKMTWGLGWLGKIHVAREGPYTPIAARIMMYFSQQDSKRTSVHPVS